MNDLEVEIVDAMWAGDVDRLHRIARCRCCCDEHTFEDCIARLWYGCRGAFSMPRDDAESWANHYELYHGMSQAQFFGWG